MGGPGSGAWYRSSSKSTDKNYCSFAMPSLLKSGLIKEGAISYGTWQWLVNGEVHSAIKYVINIETNTSPWIKVYYSSIRQNQNYDYKIFLTHTNPHYGGKRWWFVCPGMKCNRRIGVLYLGATFLCRHCHKMAYTTQNQITCNRLTIRAFKLAARLNHKGSVIDGFSGQKPKGMHWKTYNRKVDELKRIANIGLADAIARFGDVF